NAGADLYGEQVNFEITSSDVSNLEIKLHRGTSIAGVIAVESGTDPAILEQASQFLLYAATMTPSSDALPSSTSTKINSDGSFRLSGLRPGKLRFSLRGPIGLQVSRVEREGAEQPQGMIEVAAGEQVTGIR